ncbi:AAA family ATPase [uncultured Desulfobacter sp.]|uniref:ExeA family protein n=1 Tax=uncultured Desulfobacter sp. TaxID=240139 RepID=UPI002AAC2666|nr:AAA family ATPase [uncultured Desulfobacter sp.]
MMYYRTLHLEKEPFSNSPDPGVFFNSRQHLTALQKLEISIRLRRGLNVVTGDVGTGKTTVCRQLIRKIDTDEKIRYFLILDPGFASPKEFLTLILCQFTGAPLDTHRHDNELTLKEKIKVNLFSSGVDNDTTTVLMIDEGQKLPLYCLETLRELLNYETNDKKLLQIVIFAQKEFDKMIRGMENFVDRINFRFTFLPLSFFETRALIRFRIDLAASIGHDTENQLPGFTFFGFWAIYRITRGYPRKIINLCHHVLLNMIIQDRQRAGSFFVHACAGDIFPDYQERIRISLPPALSVFAMVIVFVLAFHVKTLVKIAPEPIQQKVFEWASSNSSTVDHAAMGLTPALDTVEIVKKYPVFVQSEPSAPVIVVPSGFDKISGGEPNLIGYAKIPDGSSLRAMISVIYGTYSKKILQKILQENAGIEDPNLILNGEVIYFPVIRETSAHWLPEHICLAAGSFSDLNKAYNKAWEYRKQGLDARTLSTWSVENGFIFYVVLNRVFTDKSTAQAFSAQLSESFGEFQETEIAGLIENRKIL